ncbi:phage portal protein [Streptomyces mirabilis]
MATEAEALRLVGLLEDELRTRRTDIDRHEAYYRGKQPLKFASDEFRKYHGARYKDFADNWVQVVSDSPVERLTVTGVQPAGMTEADKESWRVWQMNGLDADSQLGFLGAVNAGRSFVLVWGNPDDPETPEVTFEDASQCVVVYEPGSRRKRRAALKRWEDGADDYATLYLSDEVWKFKRARPGQAQKSTGMQDAETELQKWELRETGEEPNPQANPLGVVPMVELPNKPTLVSDPISDVSGVVAMQDAVNLLWAQLFTAADYASFPTRIVLGAERPVVPVLDETGQIVGERPVDMDRFAVDRVQFFSGDDVRTAEWSAANLNAYTDIIEVAVGHIAAQTRTPQHYLIGKMSNLSADALLAAETGLVKRVEEKQIWFGQALREVFRLIALAQGDEAKALAVAGGRVMWANAESRSLGQLTDALTKLKAIGFPFEFLALKYGLTPTEVADLITMRDREALADPVGAFTASLARDPANGAPDNVDQQPGE